MVLSADWVLGRKKLKTRTSCYLLQVGWSGPWNRLALKVRQDIEGRGTRVYITGRAKTESGILANYCWAMSHPVAGTG